MPAHVIRGRHLWALMGASMLLCAARMCALRPKEPRVHAHRPAALLAALISLVGLACSEQSTAPMTFPMGTVPSPSGAPAPNGPTTPDPAMPTPANPVTGPMTPPAQPSVPGPTPSQGPENPAQPGPTTMTDLDGAMPDTDAGPGSTDAGAPLPIPEPVTEPYVWGYGLGISDVPAAVAFYTEVMKMTVEREVDRGDRSETVLYASEADRGGRLVLMHFNDGRPTRKITTKLVWQSSNASAVNRAAAMHPDYQSRLNFGIVQFDGPETYIQEVGGIFDSEGTGINVPYLIAMGFAVSDLSSSRRFYRDALGMEESSLGTFSVTDATGAGSITEYSFRHPAGPGIVLQAWTPARNAKDNPVKVVLFVPDAQAVADAVVAGGGVLVEPAARTQVYDNRLLIVAKDPDGYLLELVQ